MSDSKPPSSTSRIVWLVQIFLIELKPNHVLMECITGSLHCLIEKLRVQQGYLH